MTTASVLLLTLLAQPDVAEPGSRPTPAVPATVASPAKAPVPLVDHAPPLGVLRAAVRATLLAEPERAASLVSRARKSALLPEVRLRAERRFGRSEGLDLVPAPSSPSDPVALDTVDDVRYEIRATWDLARVVFNPDELHAQAQALRMADARMEAESLVIRLYFERRRLLADRAAGRAPETASMRVDEIEAELDALTGGAFFAPNKRGRRRDPVTQPHDARQHKRFAVSLEATVHLVDRDLGARTRDISRSGICVIVAEPIPQGDEVKLDLVLAFGKAAFSEPLSVRARVVWCTPIGNAFQVGVMYLALSPERLRFLEMFVRFLDGSLSPEGVAVENPPEDSTTPEPAALERARLEKDNPFRR